jgi:hypothetical protein
VPGIDIEHARTALEAVGTACTNSCCNRTINVQVDHRVPYAANPETRLGNLDPLCAGAGSCHHRKTHEGWELEEGTGRRRLLPPDHPDHAKNRASRNGDTGPPEHVEQPTLC